MPDHPEATIRLHKVRIKSLTADLAAAQTALKDKWVLNFKCSQHLSVVISIEQALP